MRFRFTPPNILFIRESYTTSFERYYLITADRHFDNPKSDRELQLKHLKWAKEHDAKILDLGDLFCAMQGRNDPRRDRASIMYKHNKPGYYDEIVKDAVDFFAPYADQFLLLGMGNHETSVLKNADTNLTDRLATELRRLTTDPAIGAPFVGGYSGFVRFSFAFDCPNSTGRVQSFDLLYHHGSGGGGAVTRGVIQHARRAATYDADIVVSGHIHESWILTNIRVGLNSNATDIVKRKQVHISVPTYKDDFADGAYGWANEKGMPPKPLGAVALRFYFNQSTEKIDYSAQVLE